MIKLQTSGTVLVVGISGELDMVMAKEFNAKVDEMLLANGKIKELLLDVSGTSFIDSTGLGAIIGRYKVMKLRGGTVSIVGADKSVRKVLEMAGLKKLMSIV